jgi:hydrogenase nickel incorporation protein HypA/HybF
MHEFALATRIVERVSEALERQRPGAQVATIRLRVGQLSGVYVDALQFGLDLLLPQSPLAGAQTVIESLPPCLHCRNCAQDSEVHQPPLRCPACGSAEVDVVGGRELEIESVELAEEPNSCPSASN